MTTEFTTKGMGLATYLWFMDCEIIKTVWIDKSCIWTFSRTERLAKLIEEYNSGQASVDPKQYFPKVTEFKRMVYAQR